MFDCVTIEVMAMRTLMKIPFLTQTARGLAISPIKFIILHTKFTCDRVLIMLGSKRAWNSLRYIEGS